MVGYKPAQNFGLPVVGVGLLAQIFLLNYGHKLSNRFKLQWGFYFTAMIVITVPFFAHLLGNQAAYYSVFVLLCAFGLVNGMT